MKMKEFVEMMPDTLHSTRKSGLDSFFAMTDILGRLLGTVVAL